MRLDFTQTLDYGLELLKRAAVPATIVSLGTSFVGATLVVMVGFLVLAPIGVGLASALDGDGIMGWILGAVAFAIGILLWVIFTVLVIGTTTAIGLAGMHAVLDEGARTGATNLDTATNAMKEYWRPMVTTVFAVMGYVLIAMVGWMTLILIPVVIIAAFYFLPHWALAPVVVLKEGLSGGAALARSRELVSPNYWAVLGMLFLVGFGSAVVSGILGAILGFIPIIGQILSFALGGVLIVAGAAFIHAAYLLITGQAPGGPNAPETPHAGPAAP